MLSKDRNLAGKIEPNAGKMETKMVQSHSLYFFIIFLKGVQLELHLDFFPEGVNHLTLETSWEETDV